jgi:putative membrane-bound dehydrogenase-like protein
MKCKAILNALLFPCSCFIVCCGPAPTVPPGFEIEPGFTLELVANEPLVKDPVDLEFNSNGDAVVLEMPGYPFEDQQSRIKILKDTDGNGVYDAEVLFAENLRMATSILPFKNGLLVAAPPFLLHLKDIDADDRADAVDTLMTGFATENLQHNYNGLTYGIDNWIYAANGGNSGKPYWWGDTTSVLDLRGQDFRFNLEQKKLERIGESSGGFGLGMNEWGNLFETHNLTHISHLVFPDRYLHGLQLSLDHTLSNISDHEENGLARVYPIGEQESRVNHPEQSGYFSGSCGIAYYDDNTLGPEYEQSVWVADVVLNLIHVDKIKPRGASFTATRMKEKKEFLTSSDRSFRPVNITVGPDGSLYVVDMHRKVIEHPEWIPDEIEKGLDLHAGKDQGRIYRIRKENSKPKPFDVAQWKTIDGMISGLEHPNQWVRNTSHRLLMDQTLDNVHLENLSKLLRSDSDKARLHAMWILETNRALTPDQMMEALKDPSDGIKENALVITEKDLSTNHALLLKCIALTSDENQRVRMQAALSLSTISKDALKKNQDEILNGLIQASTKPMDEWGIMAITLASKNAAANFFKQLALAQQTPNKEALLTSLAMLCGNSTGHVKTVLEMLNTAGLSNNSQRSIIVQLMKGNNSSINGKSLQPLISQLERTGDVGLIAALAALRNKFNLSPSPEFLTHSKEALRNVLDTALNDSLRFAQLSLIELLTYKEKSDVLFRCLANTEPLKIQEAALRQLAVYDNPEIGLALVRRWTTLSPQTRSLAGDLLLYREIHHDALLTGLENGKINIGEMNFDLERRRTLLWWTDNETTKRRAEALFSDSGVVSRKEAMDKMKVALTLTGNASHGAEIFLSVCANCHSYGTLGKDVGPVLTEINRKSKESLLHDILDPNAAVNTKYINHRVETRTGEVHMGIVDSETDQLITLKKMGGAKITVRKTDIKSFSSLGTSLMMEGLEASMTTQDMADLLAYLQEGE